MAPTPPAPWKCCCSGSGHTCWSRSSLLTSGEQLDPREPLCPLHLCEPGLTAAGPCPSESRRAPSARAGLRPTLPACTGKALPAGQDEEFILKLINRPILVLRGLDGFVCHRRGSNQLDTNRSVYDVFHLSFSDGAYQIRGASGVGPGARGGRGGGGRGREQRPHRRPLVPPGRGGGFWHTGSHGSVCSDGERAEDFLFEFRERGRVAIRARSGKYLRGGASGLLRADADAPAGVALWEY